METFNPPNPTLLRYYRDFLESHSLARAREWGRICRSDLEAGACEAYAWGLLAGLGVEVAPNTASNASSKNVDFRCNADGIEFLTEVTCLSKKNVTKATGLADLPDGNPQYYGMLNKAIQKECRSKAKQCSGWELPTLLLIGTFHGHASFHIRPEHPGMDWVLTGETRITLPYNAQKGCFEGDSFLSTEGKHAAFIDQELEAARQSISALLVVGFGVSPPSMVGLHHLEAARPFDERALRGVRFGRLLLDRANGSLSTQWTSA